MNTACTASPLFASVSYAALRLAKVAAAGLFTTLWAFAAAANDGDRTLTVYTYDSFVAEWGPGAQIKTAFQERCDCRLNWVAVDSSLGLLGRLRLEGAATAADVVLGLDAAQAAEIAASGLFAPHGVDTAGLTLPVEWSDPLLLPFDYGYFAFIYDSRKLQTPPRSLHELAFGDAERGPTLLIQDPRTDSAGLGLLLWMRRVFGDQAGKAWRKLAPRIVTTTESWSAAYGMFLNGEADMVLSYSTSPAYHRVVEGVDAYRAALFEEGHYLQLEVAARLAQAPSPQLADMFMAFVASSEFQRYIPAGNWMYPVIASQGEEADIFAQTPRPSRALRFDATTVAAGRRDWLREWRDALNR